MIRMLLFRLLDQRQRILVVALTIPFGRNDSLHQDKDVRIYLVVAATSSPPLPRGGVSWLMRISDFL